MDKLNSKTSKYAVVFFVKENVASEVPVNWLCDENKYCLWPSESTKVRLFMKNQSCPQSDWTKHEIHLEKYASSLSKARKIAESFEYVTTEEENLGRGKRSKHRNYSSESQSSDSEPLQNKAVTKKSALPILTDAEKNVLDINSNTYLEQAVNNIDLQNNQVDNDGSEEDMASTKSNDAASVASVASSSVTIKSNNDLPMMLDKPSNQNDLKVIHSIVMKNQMILRSIESRVMKLENQENLIPAKNMDLSKVSIIKNLPINEISLVHNIEKDLENEKNKSDYIAYLSQIGGRNMKDFINRCLKATFTNEFAVSCSWLGQRNNFKICNLTIIQMIKVAVGNNFTEMKSIDFETYASEWFRLSKQRLTREKNK